MRIETHNTDTIKELTITDKKGKTIIEYKNTENKIGNLKTSKIWILQKKDLTFQILTSKNLEKQVINHIVNLITKPVSQLIENDMNNEETRNIQEIIKSCCFPPFISILKKELKR